MLLFEFQNINETKYIFFLRDKKNRNVRSQKKRNVDIPVAGASSTGVSASVSSSASGTSVSARFSRVAVGGAGPWGVQSPSLISSAARVGGLPAHLCDALFDPGWPPFYRRRSLALLSTRRSCQAAVHLLCFCFS